MKRLLYLIGVPGVGKTEAMAAATDGLPYRDVGGLVPYRRYIGGVQLGRWGTRKHGGTDGMAMDTQYRATAFLRAWKDGAIVAEGDRLANDAIFETAATAGYELDVILLHATYETIAARRGRRGSEQDEAWLKGRMTKIENLVKNWEAYPINAEQSIEAVVAELQQRPAIAALWQALADVMAEATRRKLEAEGKRETEEEARQQT